MEIRDSVVNILVVEARQNGRLTIESVQEAKPSLAEIVQTVRQSGGILTVQVKVLRDAAGSDRTGKIVAAKIEQQLASHGISLQPASLPRDQNVQVRLYIEGSPPGRLMLAAFRPGGEFDALLRQAGNCLNQS